MEKIKANFVIDIFLMIVTLTAAVSLVFPFGIIGAAWTVTISVIFGSSMRLLVLTRYLVSDTKQEQPE